MSRPSVSRNNIPNWSTGFHTNDAVQSSFPSDKYISNGVYVNKKPFNGNSWPLVFLKTITNLHIFGLLNPRIFSFLAFGWRCAHPQSSYSALQRARRTTRMALSTASIASCFFNEWEGSRVTQKKLFEPAGRWTSDNYFIPFCSILRFVCCPPHGS